MYDENLNIPILKDLLLLFYLGYKEKAFLRSCFGETGGGVLTRDFSIGDCVCGLVFLR